jgi:hypothetical protein
MNSAIRVRTGLMTLLKTPTEAHQSVTRSRGCDVRCGPVAPMSRLPAVANGRDRDTLSLSLHHLKTEMFGMRFVPLGHFFSLRRGKDQPPLAAS